MLPNLLIIGAAKSGTTSLHHYLGQHPEIFMSATKELNFWVDPEWRAKLDVYESCFRSSLPVRGESSPHYAYHPVLKGTPERIHSVVPDVKLIYVVREPVERSIAHYTQFYAMRWDERSLAEAFADVADPMNEYVAASRYATQIEQYLEFFPASSIKVIDHADLLGRRAETLRDVFAFLGVDPEFTSPAFDELQNRRDDLRRISPVLAPLYGAMVRSPLATRAVPQPVRSLGRPARRVLSRRLERPVADSELRDRLADELAGDVERLRALVGKPFATWKPFN